MKNTLVALLFIVILLVASCDKESNLSSVEQQSILVVGDSMSTGFGLAVPWPTKLADILSIPVDNSNSINGVETSYGLKIFEQVLQSNKPSDVIIMLGTNDALRGSVNNAITNLQAMADIADSQDVAVTIVTLPLITSSESQNQKAAEISTAILSFTGINVADARAAFVNAEHLLVDGIHPNDAGQELIASTIADVFIN